jgi:hypothetical protein
MGRGDPERVAQCGGGMGEGGTLVFSFQGRRRETLASDLASADLASPDLASSDLASSDVTSDLAPSDGF